MTRRIEATGVLCTSGNINYPPPLSLRVKQATHLGRLSTYNTLLFSASRRGGACLSRANSNPGHRFSSCCCPPPPDSELLLSGHDPQHGTKHTHLPPLPREDGCDAPVVDTGRSSSVRRALSGRQFSHAAHNRACPHQSAALTSLRNPGNTCCREHLDNAPRRQGSRNGSNHHHHAITPTAPPSYAASKQHRRRRFRANPPNQTKTRAPCWGFSSPGDRCTWTRCCCCFYGSEA